MEETKRFTWWVSDRSCLLCHRKTLQVDPPVDGWSHYCPVCEALVITHKDRPPWPAGSAIGFVAAVPIQISFYWGKRALATSQRDRADGPQPQEVPGDLP